MFKDKKIYCSLRNLYYSMKDWETTKDNRELAKKIKPFKDIHKGASCVVVGNGPSLKATDLSRIYELGIPTFACNRINLIFPQTKWRPTYYFISDARIASQYTEEIEGVPENQRFFPKRFRNQIKHGTFYNDIYFDYQNEGKFSLNAAKGIYPAGSVTIEMIQFAYYMGFSEIYLIGVDFNYAVTDRIDQKSYTYHGESNYFAEGYLKEGEIAYMPNIEANLLGFKAAKEAIEGHNRIIKNATRGGKLEVFDRVDLDALMEKWERDLQHVQ